MIIDYSIINSLITCLTSACFSLTWHYVLIADKGIFDFVKKLLPNKKIFYPLLHCHKCLGIQIYLLITIALIIHFEYSILSAISAILFFSFVYPIQLVLVKWMF